MKIRHFLEFTVKLVMITLVAFAFANCSSDSVSQVEGDALDEAITEIAINDISGDIEDMAGDIAVDISAAPITDSTDQQDEAADVAIDSDLDEVVDDNSETDTRFGDEVVVIVDTAARGGNGHSQAGDSEEEFEAADAGESGDVGELSYDSDRLADPSFGGVQPKINAGSAEDDSDVELVIVGGKYAPEEHFTDIGSSANNNVNVKEKYTLEQYASDIRLPNTNTEIKTIPDTMIVVESEDLQKNIEYKKWAEVLTAEELDTYFKDEELVEVIPTDLMLEVIDTKTITDTAKILKFKK
ncbi:MAG: hypothetical protein H7A33_02570 [Deltaproteobacteria bacterium]|nr:hypothetical protein [Deltaproteobacteria bacterium]